MAKVLDGELVSFTPLVAIAQVRRQTTFTFPAGHVQHQLMDTDGNRYALFTAEITVADLIDLRQPDALVDIELPEGWLYSSRRLEQDLIIDSGGEATVLAMPGLSWQRY